MVNIKTVAELAGVSKASVSRVLNGHPSVSPELRAAVEAVIRQQGYEPNAVARALARRRTGNIALIIPRPARFAFSHPFLTEVMRGLGAAIEGEGYSLQIVTSASPERLAVIYRDGSCDGMAFAGIWADDPLARGLTEAAVPVVLIGRQPAPARVPSVWMDDEAGAALATGHLLERGYADLAMLNGPPSEASFARLRGFRHALTTAGLPWRAEQVLGGEFSVDSGRRLLAQLLERGRSPRGVFVASDTMAFGVLDGARLAGLRVPEDLAIVGFDNFPFSALTEPPLTTVDAHVFALGQRAGALLLQQVRGQVPEQPQLVLPMTLIVRRST